MPPQAKFTQTTAQLKRRRKGKKKKSDREKALHTRACTHTHTQKNLVLVDEGETFCKEKNSAQHLFQIQTWKGKGGGERERSSKHHYFSFKIHLKRLTYKRALKGKTRRACS